ncbi:MAG: carbamoyltransferase HypF [Clostridiales Family XIII bacterium]|jgi:hydrogenase maturation protein HypF|nr:carbamoyltransferase HypF [Clostridiales Family XIII bacterium]
MITRVITIRGTVQGVGFRPTTSRFARKFGMKGRVRNMGGHVQLILTDEPRRIDDFIAYLIANKPRSSEIVSVEQKEIDLVRFDGFSIVPSSAVEDEIAILPADIALCDRCLAEFRDPGNRRYGHAFISCTDCGPRFTIMERLPYDRDTTTMDDFALCAACEEEYTAADGIRYHAQTVSCHDCGPQAMWSAGEASGFANPAQTGPICSPIAGAPAIEQAITALNGGEVIALKGVGGYYFVCRADTETAVQRLRDIKLREEKPFAVMFADADSVRGYCSVSAAEAELLTSPKRPIVLLEITQGDGSFVSSLAPGVCGSSRFVGAFLPSMGLQHSLLDACGPLVMTSANISGLPIITDDEVMANFARSEPRLAGILYNERRIAAGADDSVVRVIDGRPQLLRRSKGYVPVPVYARGAAEMIAPAAPVKETRIFAAGGHLKSAFALSRGSYSYLSQYFGDLDTVEIEEVYAKNYERMKAFFGIFPRLAVCDMHPNYATTRFAEALAGGDNGGMELLRVQHHHAHIASVMAEHGLTGPVIGVAFDGTGYGADGRIWGGEVLIAEGAEFARFSHLRYVRMLGGDASMKDAWKSALSYMEAEGQAHPRNRPLSLDSSLESKVFNVNISDIVEYAERNGTLHGYAAEIDAAAAGLRAGVNSIESSSMGRLFDAVSSLLGVHHINRYEGECAVMLENAAERARRATETGKIAAEADRLALNFHMRVAEALLEQCRAAREAADTHLVCLSGGVFQNKILMEEALRLLRADGFRPYYNELVPPNDGGIALGQNYIGMLSALV